MTTRHDLLTEPLLSWRGRNRVAHRCTLPGLLAALSRGEVMDFPRARAHQQQPWSMFVTQLAAIALHRTGVDAPPTDEQAWLRHLLHLTQESHEPWTLVVQDLSKPAFFQSPVPEGSLADWKGELNSPDELDMLVTAKCHDVKTSLVSPDDVEAWAYALCTVQTMQGYPGRGYNGVARMNGGYGNRPRVGLSPGYTHGERFGRDVSVLLAEWPRLVARGLADDGLALVWCAAWDGKVGIAFSALAPHFIEACQRVRLIESEDCLIAMRATTAVRRCAPEVEGGDVGDAWSPIDRAERSALTPGSRGYDYRLLVDLLFSGKFEPSPAQIPREHDGGQMLFWASALARGQGKTEGLHERILSIPAEARSMFRSRDQHDMLSRRATDRVRDAERMRSKVLFPALKLLALGGTVPPDDFDARVDERFFQSLFATLDQASEPAKAQWEDELGRIATREVEQAIERTPLPDARFWRATTGARGMFFGCMKKHFPDLAQRSQERTGTATSDG